MIEAVSIAPFPAGRFSTIVCDPPWPFVDRLPGRGRGSGKHYSLLSLEHIAALPVAESAADDAHLYLWVPNAFFDAAFVIARGWGFTPKTVITWIKVTKAGTPRMGMGRYYRNATEQLLFATRGKLPTARRDVLNVLFSEREQHSAKPESFYEMVRRMSPEPRLELFARRAASGFAIWGDQAPAAGAAA